MTQEEPSEERSGDEPSARSGVMPSAAELLRATLEKIVFFEWRVRELSAELASAQSRAASAELERLRADESTRAAALQAQAARRAMAELESERARLASLLARPVVAPASDASLLDAEKARANALAAQLHKALGEIERQKDERARWLNEMIAQARAGDDAPAALAQFISELRGEVISLRERLRATDALLVQAGIAVPEVAEPRPEPAAPVAREPDAVLAARALWVEGRLGGLNAARDQAAAATAVSADFDRSPVAARALAEQCLRGLTAFDAARRAQAARHLAALPLAAASPALAAALSKEADPRARAAIARALAACGGDAAAALVEGLLVPTEPALVRLAALESLAAAGGDRAAAALEAASRDPSPSLRRRATALAHDLGGHDALLSRLSADPDSSVRAAAKGEQVPPLKSAALVQEAAPDPERNLRDEALHAVRTAIFGLTEIELGSAVGLAQDEAAALAERLVSEGWLARRGRRLIAGSAGPQREERGA